MFETETYLNFQALFNDCNQLSNTGG